MTAAWLDAFAEAVRSRDLAAGRELFHPACFAYGTRIGMADGLDALVDEQWAPIWHSTTGFAFEQDSVRTVESADDTVAVVGARWTSLGIDDGSTFARSGRCTIVLTRDEASPGGYLAQHTHFSEDPSAPGA